MKIVGFNFKKITVERKGDSAKGLTGTLSGNAFINKSDPNLP